MPFKIFRLNFFGKNLKTIFFEIFETKKYYVRTKKAFDCQFFFEEIIKNCCKKVINKYERRNQNKVCLNKYGNIKKC